MPFASLAQAKIACNFLSQSTPLRAPVQKELSVNGHLLVLSVLKGAGAREGMVGGGQGQSWPRRRRMWVKPKGKVWCSGLISVRGTGNILISLGLNS